MPPDGVFPVAWTSRYTDIAVTSAAAIDQLRTAGRHTAARNYAVALGVNLIINSGCSWLLFRHHKLGAAVLTVSSAELTRRAATANQRAAPALLPYPVWCAFATVISGNIWLLNRRARREW